MNILKKITKLALVLLLVGCSSGSSPSAPVIDIPIFDPGGGTATAPASSPVGVPFSITVNSDITDPMLAVELVVIFNPNFIQITDTATPKNSIDVTGSIFSQVLWAEFENNSPASGKLIITLDSSGATVSTTGELCDIEFNSSEITTPSTTAIDFTGSDVMYPPAGDTGALLIPTVYIEII